MRIKTKSNSPTVIVIEQSTMDASRNDRTAKRMDALESKLDSQYKAFMNKTDYAKQISQMQKSFVSKLDKIVSANKDLLSKSNIQKAQDLKPKFTVNVKVPKQNDAILKSFATKLLALDKSIKNMRVKAPSNGKMNKSFETILKRMEELIRTARPRMMPSPS